MKKTFKIEVDCAVCAQKCEDAIKKLDCVNDCQINFILQKMVIDAENMELAVAQAVQAARKIEPDFEIEE